MTIDQIDFNELRPDESDAARDMILRILNREFRMALSLAELPDLVNVHDTYRRAGTGSFWAASSAGSVVGCIGVLRLDGADFELRRMYVDPAFRGRGIAHRLLDIALAWCSAHGAENVYLETNEQWKAAHHLYEKRGFVAVARESLPPAFPVVRVATGFYRLRLGAR